MEELDFEKEIESYPLDFCQEMIGYIDHDIADFKVKNGLDIRMRSAVEKLTVEEYRSRKIALFEYRKKLLLDRIEKLKQND